MSSRTQEVAEATSQIRAKLIDEIVDRYLDWREQCLALASSYERWSNTATAERRLAFESYKAALDLEEHASRVYADRVGRFEREVTSRYERLALVEQMAAT